MKYARVAVAGGFGFLGSRIVNQLCAKGYEVIAFSRQSGVDIREYDQVFGYLKEKSLDVVINCAAHVGGIAYNKLHPLEVYQDNLAIGHNLLKAAVEAGVSKFVNVVPNCTYPGLLDVYREREWWDGPMHETVLTYGMPRKALWVEAWAYQRVKNFNSIHLVLPNLYGPGDHFDEIRSHALGALVKKVIEAQVKGRGTIQIWGTGKPIREWGYVDDAAEGVVLAMEKYDEIGVMNIGEGKGYTITEIAEFIRDTSGWSGKFVYDKTRPDGAPKKVLDVSKMERVLGWSPITDIKTGIAKTVEWYKTHRMSQN